MGTGNLPVPLCSGSKQEAFMRVKVHTDLVSGIFFLIFSVALFLVIPSQVKVVTDEVVNSRTFPYILSLIIMAMSLKTIALEVVRLAKKEAVETKEFDSKVEAKALFLFSLLIVYVILIQVIGYLVSSLLMVSSFLIFFKTKKWYYYAITLGLTVGIFFIFKMVLNVQLR